LSSATPLLLPPAENRESDAVPERQILAIAGSAFREISADCCGHKQNVQLYLLLLCRSEATFLATLSRDDGSLLMLLVAQTNKQTQTNNQTNNKIEQHTQTIKQTEQQTN
jgi:hypothetical protein